MLKKKKTIKKVMKGLKKASKTHAAQAKANVGPTPDRAATFAPKRKRMGMGGLV